VSGFAAGCISDIIESGLKIINGKRCIEGPELKNTSISLPILFYKPETIHRPDLETSDLLPYIQ